MIGAAQAGASTRAPVGSGNGALGDPQGKDALVAALLKSPDDKAAWDALWDALCQDEEPGRFETVCRDVLRQAPDNLLALVNLADFALQSDHPQDAVALYRRLAQLRPNDARPPRELSRILCELGSLDEAITWARRAVGNAQGDKAQACHLHLALTLLRAEQWSEGWAEYEWRLSRDEANLPKSADGGSIRLWEGEDLAGGTLLVLSEQGFGDMIQIARYLPCIPATVRTVLEAPCELVDLFRRLLGQDRVADRDEPRGHADRCCAAMSLPHLLKGVAPDIPPAPYLSADDRKSRRWRRRLQGLAGLRVGLVWAGNPQYVRDAARSVTLETLSPLASVPGVSFVSLQKGAAAGEIATVAPDWPILDVGAAMGDFDDTAALVANLDLVIAVDTAVAHLAGALGRPLWLLNRFAPHWSWPAHSDGSVWYPSARQFRQAELGDWSEPVGRLREALIELAERHGAARRRNMPAILSNVLGALSEPGLSRRPTAGRD